MKNSNLIDILNAYKDVKIDKSFNINTLISRFQESQDDMIKVQVIGIIVKNFLLEAEEMIKWIIENEKSPNCLYELYRNLDLRGKKAEELKHFMELTIGRHYLKDYDLIPKEAMALELLGMTLCVQTSQLERWNYQYIKINNKKVIGIEVIGEFNIFDSKYLKLFSELRELLLEDCRFTDFSFLKNLMKLSIKGSEESVLNNINEVDGLKKLITLEELNLSRNAIKEIKNLDTLINLKKLDLSHNLIREIANLERLTKLKYLNLECNEINKIKGLEALKNLKDLNLYNNVEIPKIEGLETLINLESLNLENNYLINEMEGFETLKNLKILNLSKDDFMTSKYGTELTYNFKSLILKNKELFTIKLNNREFNLEKRHKKTEEKLMELDHYEDGDVQNRLDNYRHYITEIKGLDNLMNLKELNLEGNQITEIKGLKNLKNLKILRLDNNNITELKGLENLINLEFLGISNNNIAVIPGLNMNSIYGYGVKEPQRLVKYCQEKFLKN